MVCLYIILTIPHNIMKNYVLMFSFLLLFIQCSKETTVDELADDSHDKVEQAVINILNKIGFNTTDTEVIKDNDQYLVEGDIMISKEYLEIASMAHKQRRTRMIISCNNLQVITIKSDLEGIFDTALTNAVTEWNTALDGLISFRLINNNNADIRVQNSDGTENGNFIGRAKAPLNGRPGNMIVIRPNSRIGGNVISTRKWKDIMMHEIGHTIGLAHTNDTNRELIAGTPRNDGNSLMNSGDGTGNLRSLSSNDILAVNTLYNSCN